MDSPCLLDRVPTEILSEILKAGATDPQKPFDPQSFPSVVSRVSSRWRQVALSTPDIWRYIVIELLLDTSPYSSTLELFKTKSPGPLQRHAKNIAIVFDVWYSRAGRQGIDLTFDYPDEAPELLVRWYFLLMSKTLSPALVNLCLEGWNNLPLLGELNELPNLEELSAKGFIQGGTNLSIKAPKLHTLDVWAWGPGALRLDSFPWHQIRHLELNVCDEDLDERLGVLRCASLTLESLALETEGSGLEHQAQPTNIVFPRVHTLFISYGNCGGLLDHFSAPELANLNIDAESMGMESIINFLKRSECDVCSLYLGPTLLMKEGIDGDIRDLFRALPTVEQLLLGQDDKELTQILLDAMHVTEGGTPVLPSLAFLELDVPVKDNDLAVSKLIDAVESRADAECARIMALGLRDLQELSCTTIRDAVQKWEREGIAVCSVSDFGQVASSIVLPECEDNRLGHQEDNIVS